MRILHLAEILIALFILLFFTNQVLTDAATDHSLSEVRPYTFTPNRPSFPTLEALGELAHCSLFTAHCHHSCDIDFTGLTLAALIDW